jgi:flagellin-like protein
MNSPQFDDRGASELIGTLMLIAIFITAIAVVGVIYLSQPIPQKVPAVSMRITNASNQIVIFNDGGDPISKGKFAILVDGTDVTSQIANSDSFGNWLIGDVITYTMPGLALPSNVKVIYTGLGASSIVIADKVLGFVDTPSQYGTFFTIYASASTHGSISPNGEIVVPAGSVITFTITPDVGYQIAGVTIDGGSAGATPSYTFSGISAQHTIAASFSNTPVNLFTINATAGTGGTITPGNVTVSSGATQTFTITPNSGYMIAAVLVNGTPIVPVPATYTFTNVTTNQTIAATFTSNYAPGCVANYYSDMAWTIPASTNVAPRIHFADPTSLPAYSSDSSPWPDLYTGGKRTQVSVNFSGFIKIPANDSYTFYLTSDDGSWLYIDGALVVDDSGEHAAQTRNNAPLNLAPGYHSFYVRMFQDPGQAVVYLNYSSPNITQTANVPLYHQPITIPAAGFTGSPVSGNAPLTVQFNDTSLDATTWMWNFGDGSPVSYLQNPSHVYSAVGTYNVSLVAANTFGSNLATKSNYITVGYYLPGINAYYYRGQTWTDLAGMRVDNEIRYADAAGQLQGDPSDEINWPIPMVGRDDDFSVMWDGYLLITAADTYTFTLRSDDGSWMWIDEGQLINNGGLHSATNVTGTIALQPGYHHIMVEMFENTGQAVARLMYSSPTMPSQQVTSLWHVTQILPPPVAGFSGSPLSGTVPLTVVFKDLSSYSPASWSWSFGDGDNTNATVQNPVHTYTTAGTYTVSLTTTNAAGSNTMTQTGYVVASPVLWTITATDGASGVISPNGTVSVIQGINQTFTITPNLGKSIVDVLIDGSSAGPVSSYTFMNVTANHTIQASFVNNTYTITASSGVNGAVSPAGVTIVNYGATPTYTIAPNSGYHVADVLVSGTSVGAVTSYMFPAVTANKTISATFVLNAPMYASIAPASGPATGGTVVSITGTNLTGTTSVTFGSTAATSVTVNNATSVTATTPAHSAGATDVVITNAGGATTASGAYTYIAAPTVSSVSPNAGPLSGGSTVTITGNNLAGATAVKFGSAVATILTNTAVSITVTPPTGTVGTVDITVTTSGGTSATSSADQYTYSALPTVSSVLPASGSLGGGTLVTITGTGFIGANAVTFGGTAATGITVVGSTTITATTPAHAAGAVNVAVTTPGGTGTGANVYTYVAAPTVSGVLPAAGPVAGSTSVTISGTGFTGATAVTFGGTAATGITVVNSNTITATTPAHTAGAVNVAVTTPGGTGTGTNVYTYAAVPTLTGVSPLNGTKKGGTSITITGTGFTGATTVAFGGTAATGVTVVSSTTITATTPAHAAGAVTVAVTTPGGTVSKTTAYTYTSP